MNFLALLAGPCRWHKYVYCRGTLAVFVSVCTILVVCLASSTKAQQVSPDLYSGMRWRLIGPHRAGRVTAVAGIVGQLETYYMGTPGGGVWKTTDAGVAWKPIFDDMHVASIGALGVAATNPNIIYVGTGEQTQGNGVYKSTDAGRTWSNTGLNETHFITSVIVSPENPNVVLVGAFGDYQPGPWRGVFKSNDAGKTWNKVLFKDEQSGVVDMCVDPQNAHIVYAVLLRSGPSPDDKVPAGPDAFIYKSTDAGATWTRTGESGLPIDGRGRIGVSVAGNRVFAIMNQGLFRSEDAGATWQKITSDARIVGNAYFSRVFSDPRNPDVIYVMQTSTYRSSDGGKTFVAFAGAPSGEDHHVLWIAPDDSRRMILGTDQGATISVNGGESWSSWLNQPTGQFYHVSTGNTFPYHAYASQQDSGTVIVPNRSDFGQITYRDWFSSGGFESGYIAPDPLNPNLIYSIGWFATVLRLDRSTAQVATVFVPPSSYRTAWETPIVFSPRDPHALYFGAQFVLKTSDGAVTWKTISPDLTMQTTTADRPKKTAEHEADEEDAAQSADRGTIETIAPSPVETNLIWAGTSNGLIHVTRDETTWANVSPAGLPAKSRVLLIEASGRNAKTAYTTITVPHDSHPYIYRTRDLGKTWEKIIAGLPDFGIARAVREDPLRPGLLYAGTETGVYVSFNDGDHWQPLQLNLPTCSVRDLAVHGRDLVAATFGRGLWILDDLSPIRQAQPEVKNAAVYLFRPEHALRVHWDNHQETPLQAQTPAGKNPPDGAILDYYLKSPVKGEIALEILDEHGNRVRRYSSMAPPPDPSMPNVPDYWFAPPDVLEATAGAHRFVWNLRQDDPTALTYSYYGNLLDYTEYTLTDHAIPGETPRYQPQGPLVPPGKYEVVLTVEGKNYREPLFVELDSRVHVSQSDLAAQYELADKIATAMTASSATFRNVSTLRLAITARRKDLKENAQAKEIVDALNAADGTSGAIANGAGDEGGLGPMNRDLARYLTMIEGADIRPPDSARSAAGQACQAVRRELEQWRKLNSETLPALNKKLQELNLAPLPVAANIVADPPCAE